MISLLLTLVALGFLWILACIVDNCLFIKFISNKFCSLSSDFSDESLTIDIKKGGRFPYGEIVFNNGECEEKFYLFVHKPMKIITFRPIHSVIFDVSHSKTLTRTTFVGCIIVVQSSSKSTEVSIYDDTYISSLKLHEKLYGRIILYQEDEKG